MKLAICGPGRSGKSEAAAYLASMSSMRYQGGTSWCFRDIVFAALKSRYDSSEQCYADRHNNREAWSEIIGKHVRPNPVAAYQSAMRSQDILEGVRRSDELAACRAASLVREWWYIDRPGCDDPTCEIRPEECDVVVHNRGTLEEFKRALLVEFMGMCGR